MKSVPLNSIWSRVISFKKKQILSKLHNFSQIFWNSVGNTWLILKANLKQILGTISFLQASIKLMKGNFNFFKFSTFQILGSSSQVQLEISRTLPQIPGQSEPLRQCGDAAELCICSENYIQHFCLLWKAL